MTVIFIKNLSLSCCLTWAVRAALCPEKSSVVGAGPAPSCAGPSAKGKCGGNDQEFQEDDSRALREAQGPSEHARGTGPAGGHWA